MSKRCATNQRVSKVLQLSEQTMIEWGDDKKIMNKTTDLLKIRQQRGHFSRMPLKSKLTSNP